MDRSKGLRVEGSKEKTVTANLFPLPTHHFPLTIHDPAPRRPQ